MNLWNLLPFSMIKIDYILNLPYAALLAYIYVLYAIGVHRNYRIKLMLFLVLTIIASGTMVLTMGPNIGRIIPPLLLILVMFSPVFELVKSLIYTDKKGTRIWLKIAIAGWLHSLSWVVWLAAMARS
ncbi:hypothetical protein [Vibrio sp. VB16]|uniref:hypothetical protein n=1 Tax=Vibrio sp. VB16 TaxID=2785746 RepID=UPI00189EC498|nr:hypothetical protein [Vibrio sp. VB16]UGA53433.1 hypothetical protein IUZ65_008920 [Vibrio sp. VB16]